MRQGIIYLMLMLTTAAILLAAMATVNATVDPFGMYGFYTRKGFNEYKPAIYNRVRLLKAYEVRGLRPESVVLGTSRVHVGMRPSHPGWAQLYGKRYNLAFDSATTKEMYAYLVHANAWGSLKQVMLGIDIHHLDDEPATTEPGFDQTLLMNEYTWLNVSRMFAADFTILTSFDTLKESINTIHAQNDVQPVWLAPDGQRLGQVFFHLAWNDYMKCGPRCYFDEIDKKEVGYKLAWKINYSPETPVVEQPSEVNPSIAFESDTAYEYIRKIIYYCREHHIKLTLFMTPSHAHQLELAAATGRWNIMENGKRKIVKLLAQESKEHSDEAPIPFYDFSGYSSITTEPLSPEGSRQEMRYYWENSHFKENVGDMVLDKILGTHSPGVTVPADFGVLLTPDNIEEVLAANRQKHVEYHQSHSEEMAAIAGWVHAYKKEHGIAE